MALSFFRSTYKNAAGGPFVTPGSGFTGISPTSRVDERKHVCLVNIRAETSERVSKQSGPSGCAVASAASRATNGAIFQ